MRFFLLATLAVLASEAAAAAPAVPPWGVELSYIDESAAPGDDFFLHGNGGWMKTAEIPADRSYAGVNLEIDKRNDEKKKAIVAELHTRAELSVEERKLRDLYDAFTDQAAIDAKGLKPVATDLARIRSLRTYRGVAAAMGRVRLMLDGPFNLYIATDDKNPNAYSLNLVQSGLGLPNRDFYLRDEQEFAETRALYRKHLIRMLSLAGNGNVAVRATAVLKLEHDLAVASWPAADRRDVDKVYNPMRVSELYRLAPTFPWRVFLKAAGVPLNSPKGERVAIVHEKSAFPKLAAIFTGTPVSVWRDYLTVHYLHRFAPFLPRRVDAMNFAFYGKVLEGNEQQLDRATRGLDFVDEEMGEALGKLYAAKYFPPEAKAKADALVHNLLKAYEADIKTLDWMTPATRAKALEKLSQYTLKIGYPDRWRDYSALAIARDDLVGDVKNAAEFEWKRELARIDGPVDRGEWVMSVPTNNAYYMRSRNEIVFPAGILQPPFFDPDADDAVNYGEIGATIGHEISHGFDDQGSKYDGTGMRTSWWTDEDRANFDARTAALAAQYDAYEPLPGIHINGKLTLGENIADVAGLAIAYKAYHIALQGKEAPVLDRLTGDQRFYLAYAQSWREKNRDAITRDRLLSNPHSPAAYRVNGVVRNDDGWYAAFAIKPTDKFYLAPEKRVKLW